ncbi:anti-sigma B factor antagonist [Sanguibacter antarcticus]|uniref:Anti-sigma B factor antagonist n=2 Tax=Sanguibacter antarcticus TaxID=372484 RepID=A0A2A9E5Y6_9MICO|nr:anti-sigma B factor antagonist [Sanguibacter antarcticus]
MGNAEVGAFALDDKNESRWILTGEIDISVHEKFREVWSVDRRSATPVDVDMSDVTFIDSSGLRILYDARRATPEDEVPTLTNVPERVRWIIDVTGLTEMFRLVPAAPES